MENQDIAAEIKTKIDICKENIKAGKVAENEKIILDIEKLIEQYKPENNTQKLIINNRISEVNSLKNYSQIGDKEKKEKRNTFYGKVETIDLVDCEKWIKENKDDWQRELASINNFVKKFPFENNSIKISDIKKYTIGTGRGSFCLEVENETPGEMGQRSSLAYHIYWSLEDNSFAIRDGVIKKVVSLKEAESIYIDLKDNLDKMLVLADTNRIHLIEETRRNLQLPISNVLQKILFLYFPDKFMGYYSKAYVYKIAAMMGISNTSDVFQTNHEIAEKVIKKIRDAELSERDKTVGFTIYLWRKWDDYLKKSVG
ncbi:MAG: hypothetical protein CVU43_11805 [Chloroflexi bacterium HGW-Chloroflexi-5]|jgi:hypothetical protein|nr:MAG: hypothetical protein CVU43_11805 [Chloroflexi bacterium HGW-Chloroflexi-5]